MRKWTQDRRVDSWIECRTRNGRGEVTGRSVELVPGDVGGEVKELMD